MSSARTLEVVVITGQSGAGRRTAAHAMEDLGWYVVDNLPPRMIAVLVDQMAEAGTERVAVVVDVRSRELTEELPAALRELAERGAQVTLLFLEASDEVIVQRQESSRRPLPLQGDDRLVEGIVRERRLLADLRGHADIVVDTSRLSARQLVQRIDNHFGSAETDTLRVAIITFGFKYGLPVDSDIVFDVRFLPNPYWVPELRPRTGLSPEVASYVLGHEAAGQFQQRAQEMIATIAPGYVREGKRQVTLAIGCTGGKHRSTAMAEELASRLRRDGYSVKTLHRDLGKE